MFTLYKIFFEKKLENINEDTKLIAKNVKTITKRSYLFIGILSAVFLSIAILSYEILCSNGSFEIYLNILDSYNLEKVKYYLYLWLYVAFYMFGYIAILTGTMMMIKIFGDEKKSGKHLRIAGSVIMIIIGLLLLLKPELITFV